MTRVGAAMAYSGVGARVEETTARRLGRRLGMHLFRHCAATSLALEAPEHVREAAALLGHRRLSTAERYGRAPGRGVGAPILGRGQG